MSDIGLDLHEEDMIVSKDFTFESAFDATQTLLNRFSSEDRPTAIFASTDLMAIGAIKAIESQGLKVPDDISVIGFDDISLANLSSPALTTIRQDKVEIGKQVAVILNGLINKNLVWQANRIPVTLVSRDTVKNLLTTE
jgi:DNA-binding LacI/PurR family transcriptional regulator